MHKTNFFVHLRFIFALCSAYSNIQYPAYQKGCWITDLRLPVWKPESGWKFDLPFHPSEISQMSGTQLGTPVDFFVKSKLSPCGSAAM